jgi:hypothetical protein
MNTNKLLQGGIAAVVVVFVVAMGSGLTRRVEAADTDASVAFQLCTAEGDGAVEKCGIFGLPPTYQVPSGRRLIIEQVSGDCADDDAPALPLRASIVAQTRGFVASHAIIGVPNPDSPGGRIPLTLTRIYADANSSVTIGLKEVPVFAGRLCRLTFSGLLVK